MGNKGIAHKIDKHVVQIIYYSVKTQLHLGTQILSLNYAKILIFGHFYCIVLTNSFLIWLLKKILFYKSYLLTKWIKKLLNIQKILILESFEIFWNVGDRGNNNFWYIDKAV